MPQIGTEVMDGEPALTRAGGAGGGGQEDTVVTYIAEDRDLTGVTEASGCASVHGR